MLATFAVEVGLAAYTLWRYRSSFTTKLTTALLICLATFQLAEYMVCGSVGSTNLRWSQLGYAAITLLPALGLHLVFAIANKKNLGIIGASYAVAGLFAGYFLFSPTAFSGHECMGNYVIFQVDSPAVTIYTAYYYGMLLAGIACSWYYARTAKPKIARALQAFVAGYILFMLPTTAVNLINPETAAGIPSIMCGFAVLFALTLTGWVIPNVAEQKYESTQQQKRPAR